MTQEFSFSVVGRKPVSGHKILYLLVIFLIFRSGTAFALL